MRRTANCDGGHAWLLLYQLSYDYESTLSLSFMPKVKTNPSLISRSLLQLNRDTAAVWSPSPAIMCRHAGCISHYRIDLPCHRSSMAATTAATVLARPTRKTNPAPCSERNLPVIK